MNENPAYQEEPREELLNGKIYMMSSPSVNHNRVSFNISHIFWNYLKGKKCETFGDGTDVYLTDNDRVIPDVMIVCNRDIIKKDGIHGAPDLVIEVLSPSTARYDRGHKKDAYEAASVQEYWIVEPEVRSLEVYLLKDRKFILDNVYSIYPDYLLEKMSDEEKAAIPTEFRCSLYDELTITLEDVFADTF